MKRKQFSRAWVSLALVCSLVLGGTIHINAQNGTDGSKETIHTERSSEQEQKREQDTQKGIETEQVQSQKKKTGTLQWEQESEPGDAGVEAEQAPKQQEEEYGDTEDVRVFIVLEGDSALEKGFSAAQIGGSQQAKAFSQEKEEQQGQVVDEIQQALDSHDVEVHYQFSLLTNAVSATVQYGDIERIRKVSGVKDVYVAPKYYLQDSETSHTDSKRQTAVPNTVTSGEMVGSYRTWDSGYTGAGQRIAIIDTGIDKEHPSFDPGAFAYGRSLTGTGNGAPSGELMDAGDISEVFGQLKIAKKVRGISPKSLYVNEKIAYAFNYERKDLDVSHESDAHGTHVAGIAAANQYVPQKKGGYQEQPDGVAGIAKNAQILVMKVFGEKKEAFSDDYLAAIEDALVLGADVINLSLGTNNPGESMAYSGEAYVNKVFRRLMKSDIVVSISAGNNGAWSDASSQSHNRALDVNMNMLGSPGSYSNGLTVASAVNAGYTGCGFKLGKKTYFYEEAKNQGNIAAMASLDTSGSGTDYPYVYLESFGEAQDYNGLDVRGKIVFVSKGEISYAKKHENAQNAGAAALFIYNDEFSFPKLDLDGSKAVIPCAMLGWEDSWNLQTSKEERVIRILSQSVSSQKASKGYRMSDFSAWGVPGDLALKPEITAPGENIYSALEDGAYGSMSGTSMAAPSIAGMSALVSEYIERNRLEKKTGLGKRALIQSLLMSTAIPLKEKDKEEYSPRKQGSGLANVEAATKTPAYLLVGKKKGNDGKVKAELGDDPQRKGAYGFTFYVHNLSDKNQYYTLDTSVLTEQILNKKWIQGSSHKLQPEVTYTSENQVYLYDLNNDQRVDRQDAAALLRHVNESARQERVVQNQEKFDFNGDGVVNTLDVYRFLRELENPSADFSQKVLEVAKTAKISVDVKLSEKDKKYLDTNFKHGMYIDGFVYLKGAVDLSIPMLAFYGNWTESSMFEPYRYLEAANGSRDEVTYSGVERTNYLNYYSAEEDSTFCYGSNLYLEGGDQEYLPERNAFSTKSGDRVVSAVYTLIRNAAVVETSITNDKTGEVYYHYQEENMPAAYYDPEEARWCNTKYTSVLDWEGKDKKGKLLPGGTRVRFTVKALPEYYKDKPKKAAKGASFSVPITIDNEKPKLISLKDAEPGKIQVTFQDNRYTAAVKVYGQDQKTLLKAYAVNQKKPGTVVNITIKDPKKVFYLKLIDYAGNTVFYRVNRNQETDSSAADKVTLDHTKLTLIKGNSAQLKATVSPEGIRDTSVTWSSENPAVAVVDQKGKVTGKAPGTVRIIAKANAKNSHGETVTAQCQVTVEEISVSLNAILRDTDGDAYFSSFDTAKLPAYSKLSGKQKNNYLAAVEMGDKILAAVEVENMKSELYVVDPQKQYQAVSKGILDWRPADLAYGPTSDLVFGIEGSVLYWFESKDITSFEGVMDMADCTHGDKLVGVTYAGSTEEKEYIEWFYMVSQSGKLYQMGYKPHTQEFVYPDIFKELGNTRIRIGEECNYNTLCYDPVSGYIFWSVAEGSELYALTYHADPAKEAVKAELVGTFPKGYGAAVLYGVGNAHAAEKEAEYVEK